MGIYLEDFKITVKDDPVDRVALRFRKDAVAFYRAHFEVGLRLPLDPFVYEFLEATSAAPIGINLHTMHLLVCFVIVCQALGFEPRLPVFLHFFTLSKVGPKAGDLLDAPTRLDGPSLFIEPLNKVQNWNEHYILVKSRDGWNFSLPRSESDRKEVKKLKMKLEIEFETKNALREALRIQVTEDGKFVSQERKFEWLLLVDPEDEVWMRRA